MSRNVEGGGLPESDRFPAPRIRALRRRCSATTPLSANCSAPIAAQKLPHAWLIGGREGIGKATLAWRFARFILAHPDPTTPSGRRRQRSQRRARGAGRAPGSWRSHTRILWRCVASWNSQSKNFYTEIRVEDVRAALELFHQSAGAGGWRICIVDSAEDLNRAGANALLKMIEEPPPRSLFLIVAHQPGQVLATIRSRCRSLHAGAPRAGGYRERRRRPRRALERDRAGRCRATRRRGRTDRCARRSSASIRRRAKPAR